MEEEEKVDGREGGQREGGPVGALVEHVTRTWEEEERRQFCGMTSALCKA